MVVPNEGSAAPITDERLDWIERWANGWKSLLTDRDPDHYYEQLPLEVAVDMILELTEKRRELVWTLRQGIRDGSDNSAVIASALIVLGETP